jgi:hypothetical protein
VTRAPALTAQDDARFIGGMVTRRVSPRAPGFDRE